MKLMYNSLVKYIMSGSIRDSVDIKFVNISDDNLQFYPAASYLLRQGHPLPYVAINGVVRFCGPIRHEVVYKEIEKSL